MREVFELHKIASRSKTDTLIQKRHRSHTATQPRPLSYRLKQFFRQYNTRVWSSYYLALIVASFATGILVEKTNLAKNIMDRVRETNQTQIEIVDHSSFNLTASPGMVAVVTFPNGDRVGDTAEGVRFLEASYVSLTQSHSTSSSSAHHSWGLISYKPPSGRYVIDFSTRDQGTYTYTFQAYDIFGNQMITLTNTITLESSEHQRYTLNYSKHTSQPLRFSFLDKTIKL